MGIWGISKWGSSIWGSGSALALNSLDPAVISERGGQVITATGTFPQGEALTVTIDGVSCFGASGRGYSPTSLDGLTLKFAAPPLSKGTAQTVLIVSSVGSDSGSIDVVERSWGSAEHEAHRRHPPWAGVGARRLKLEDSV